EPEVSEGSGERRMRFRTGRLVEERENLAVMRIYRHLEPAPLPSSEADGRFRHGLVYDDERALTRNEAPRHLARGVERMRHLVGGDSDISAYPPPMGGPGPRLEPMNRARHRNGAVGMCHGPGHPPPPEPMPDRATDLACYQVTDEIQRHDVPCR